MNRGLFEFAVTPAGDLVTSAGNIEALRRLWLDRTLITNRTIGPGDRGDFDHGAWHSSCHLAGAGGVRITRDGRPVWLEISHDGASDSYYASATVGDVGGARTVPVTSAEGQELLSGARLAGFVEGTSVGRIAARGVSDPSSLFNGWKRQDFDRPGDSGGEGGKVWEHWCTLRDIRSSSRIGSSVLRAFVELCAALGDRFAVTIARGRRQYHHPDQVCAMVVAGFCARDSALWDTTPVAIPDDLERLFQEASPAQALQAAAALDWTDGPRYYMFERRISSWSAAARVNADLAAFRH